MKKRLIYIFPNEAPFSRKDIDFLSKKFDVITLNQNWAKKSKMIANLVRQFAFLIRFMPKSSATIIMFGGYWSILPSFLGKIFRKHVFIIPGGTDCVSFPEYNYGNLRKPLMRSIIKYSFKLSTRLLPVDKSLVTNDYTYDRNVKMRRQGYLNYFPNLKTPYTVIHNGFDADYWMAGGVEKDRYHFTTIARVVDQARFQIKGIDLVIQLAGHYPNHFFHIIGMDLDFSKSLGPLPGNLIVHDFMDSDKIKEILGKSQFYLQLSVSEGFPNALCEAMLCECIPVCSNVGGMPFIIENTGILIEHKNLELILDKLSEIIKKEPAELKILGSNARMNIKNRFPIDRREKAFIELLEGSIVNYLGDYDQ
jgi:glycosyltransferase involved in cell wall biosynthesis